MFISNSILLILVSSLALVSSVVVITAVNAVHSVFALIFVFVNVATILLIFRVEFLSVLLLVVYVGAVATLFLFVVMMLNIKVYEISSVTVYYAPLGLLLTLILFVELSYIVNYDLLSAAGAIYDKHTLISNVSNPLLRGVSYKEQLLNVSDVQLLGSVLYTDFVFAFILGGLLLFLAMVGAIVLTLSKQRAAKRQDIFKQVSVIVSQRIRFQR